MILHKHYSPVSVLRFVDVCDVTERKLTSIDNKVLNQNIHIDKVLKARNKQAKCITFGCTKIWNLYNMYSLMILILKINSQSAYYCHSAFCCPSWYGQKCRKHYCFSKNFWKIVWNIQNLRKKGIWKYNVY